MRSTGIGTGVAGTTVDRRSLIARLMRATADPTCSCVAFGIDEAGVCRVLNIDGDIHVLAPDGDGRYDWAPLGWAAPKGP